MDRERPQGASFQNAACRESDWEISQGSGCLGNQAAHRPITSTALSYFQHSRVLFLPSVHGANPEQVIGGMGELHPAIRVLRLISSFLFVSSLCTFLHALFTTTYLPYTTPRSCSRGAVSSFVLAQLSRSALGSSGPAKHEPRQACRCLSLLPTSSCRSRVLDGHLEFGNACTIN